MPVNKGRDFSEMLPSRQPEYESKAQRLNNVYAESGLTRRCDVYPELAAAV